MAKRPPKKKADPIDLLENVDQLARPAIQGAAAVMGEFFGLLPKGTAAIAMQRAAVDHIRTRMLVDAGLRDAGMSVPDSKVGDLIAKTQKKPPVGLLPSHEPEPQTAAGRAKLIVNHFPSCSGISNDRTLCGKQEGLSAEPELILHRSYDIANPMRVTCVDCLRSMSAQCLDRAVSLGRRFTPEQLEAAIRLLGDPK